MKLLTAITFALLSSGVFQAVGAALPQQSHLVQPRPNIILCMADDLGWGDVGYNGNEVIKTPNLDSMADEGVRFNRFYAAAPVCSPTRASCLTGRHPYRTGVFFANTGILRQEEITIAELLKPLGYATGHFGKWHLGTLTDAEPDANRGGKKRAELLNPPNRHGFDVFFSTESRVPTWDPMKMPVSFQGKESKRFGWSFIKKHEATQPFGTHYWSVDGKVTQNLSGDDSRIIMDRAIPFIEQAARRKQPFLAVIWFHAPHLPCVAGPKYAAMYQDRGFKMQQYAGCITALDEQMGRLRAKLKALGVYDNTLLFFTSDNGPEKRTPGTAGPFRDRKRSLHEGGLRVPGLLTWPNMIKAPLATDAPCTTSDYLPTIVEILGIAPPPYQLDGTSLLPLLQGKQFKRSPIWFASGGQRAANDMRYKLYWSENKVALYDLLEDPGEKNNIGPQHPEIVKRLTTGFTHWFATCRESFQGKEYGTKSFEKVPQKWPAP